MIRPSYANLSILNIFFLLVAFFVVKPVVAQNVETNALILKWERLASRADEVLERSQASNDTLKIILSDLLKQRKEVYEKQLSSDLEISNFSEELEALGPLPAEGFSGNATIEKRRTELNKLIAEATVPFVISNAMLKRTDFLIEETNTILRGRLTQKLFGYGATPFNRNLWLPAAKDLAAFFGRMIRETNAVIKSDTQRTLAIQKIPIMVVLCLAALFSFLVFFKGFFYNTLKLIPDSERTSLKTVTQVTLSFLSHLALLFSALLIIQALKFSGLFGFNGTALVDSLIPVALTLVSARWLAENLCHNRFKLQELGALVVNNGFTGSRQISYISEL